MLTRADAKSTEALVRLGRTDDGRALMEIVRMALGTSKDTLITMAGLESIARMQGRAQAFKELLELIERAPAVLEKMSNKT